VCVCEREREREEESVCISVLEELKEESREEKSIRMRCVCVYVCMRESVCECVRGV
jgi:hypothetical protein